MYWVRLWAECATFNFDYYTSFLQKLKTGAVRDIDRYQKKLADRLQKQAELDKNGIISTTSYLICQFSCLLISVKHKYFKRNFRIGFNIGLYDDFGYIPLN